VAVMGTAIRGSHAWTRGVTTKSCLQPSLAREERMVLAASAESWPRFYMSTSTAHVCKCVCVIGWCAASVRGKLASALHKKHGTLVIKTCEFRIKYNADPAQP
jgi:hypothetical protein